MVVVSRRMYDDVVVCSEKVGSAVLHLGTVPSKTNLRGIWVLRVCVILVP